MATRWIACLLAASLCAAEPAIKADHRGDPLPPLARLRIGSTRFRHGGEITAVAFSPDGRVLATAGRDNMLRLWDRASGKELAHFQAPRCVALTFAERGKSLLWCDDRGTLYRCDAGQRGESLDGRHQRVKRFPLRPNERIETAAFTPDGSLVAVGDSGRRVWLHSRSAVIELPESVQALALDRAGRLLAVNNGRAGIVLYELPGKEGAHMLRRFGSEAVRILAFSPDGRTLAAGDFENCIRLWDVATGRPVCSLEGHQQVPISGKNGVFCLTFSPDSKTLASGAADGTVRLWNVDVGEETAHCAGHGGIARTLAFSPDGKTLASGGSDYVLRLWDSATGREGGPVKDAGGAVSGMAVSPDGRTLALIRAPGRLSLWDLTTGKEHGKTPKLPTLAAAAFSKDGRTLMSASAAGHLHFCDVVTGEEARPAQNVHISVRLLTLAHDGETVACCGSDRRIVLWDAKAAKELRRFRLQGNNVAGLLFSPDGRALISAGTTGIGLWSVREPDADRPLSDQIGGVFAVAISPDGRTLATGGPEGAVRLWEVMSSKQRRVMYGDKALVRSAIFSADGMLLATGSSNGAVCLWEVGTGKRLRIFAGHRGEVVAAAFAGRGSALVTAGRDGTALVWDLSGLSEAVRSRVIELSSRQLQTLWRDLESADAAPAYEAVETLARAPAQAVSFLGEQVSPVSVEKLARLMKELDSDQFKVRNQAMKDLAQMGKFAESSLRKLLANKPTLEVRRRVEELLALLADPTSETEYLRALRAVEVLEKIGSAEARRVLQTLAGGVEEAELTRQAKASLARLPRRTAP